MYRSRAHVPAAAHAAVVFALVNVLSIGHAYGQKSTPRQIGGMTLLVDSSLEIEAATEPDLIKWPIVADWDSAGRLVVVECGGVAKPIVEHNKQLLHRIVRLVDTNGDGKFDKRIVAADKLAFPEGVLCVGNSLLVCAPPEIWKLTDGDGDGVCESREVWFNPGTITGCANDLHGPYMGRDGWIYWCKGAFAEQKHTIISGKELTTKAAHIFRRRFEGGAIEPVMTGGMDNPVEMAMSHAGERFFTSTFLQHPAAGKRDGIAHAIYGGVYGKQHDVLLGHKRTGDLLPIMTHLGPAAPSGLICLESSRLLGQSEAVDTLVAAQFNLHKVTAHDLVTRGAGFTTKDRELVSSERIDFHPTDIIEAPDGSLLVIDTGGWYNLCCPSSGIDQSIALGGIYRLTSPATKKPVSATGRDPQQLSVQELTTLVNDSSQPLRDRQSALWQVCRRNDDSSRESITAALHSPEASLRQIAAHAASVQRIVSALPAIEKALSKESNAHAKRALAEALGRLGNADSIPVIIQALMNVEDDRMLEHSLLYALMELDQPQYLSQQLTSPNPDQRRIAQMIIDQLGRSDLLSPSEVLKNLVSNDARLRQNSAEILVKHVDWANANGVAFEEAWSAALKESSVRGPFAAVLAAWSTSGSMKDAIGKRLSVAADAPASDQEALLELLADIRNQQIPSEWSGPIVGLLKKTKGSSHQRLVRWLASMKVEGDGAKQITNTLLELSQSQKEISDKLRLLAALPGSSQLGDSQLENLVIDSFLGQHGAAASGDAASAMARIQFDRPAAEHLIDGLSQAQPLQLLQVVASVSSLKQDELDKRLLERLTKTSASRTLPLDQVKSMYRNRSEGLRNRVQSAIDDIGKPSADVEAKLDGLLEKLKPGDKTRGFQVFRSAKAACSACHRIGYVGGQIGPDLTRIGATRTRRALLEAIVFPNARLEQSYAPLRVLTTDGRVYNGIVVRDSDGVIELVTSATERVTIPHADVEQRLPSQVSIMPAGLEQQMTMDELADLLTLLEGTR